MHGEFNYVLRLESTLEIGREAKNISLELNQILVSRWDSDNQMTDTAGMLRTVPVGSNWLVAPTLGLSTPRKRRRELGLKYYHWIQVAKSRLNIEPICQTALLHHLHGLLRLDPKETYEKT